MKKAIVYAYTASNLGDDLFIYTLARRYPNTTFFIFAPRHYERTFQSIPNIQIIYNDGFFQKILYKIAKPFSTIGRIAKKCDVGIYIGGSLFIETVHWKKELNRVRAMKDKQLPFFIIGANFGPYESRKFYDAYETFFQTCTDICFRDTFSRNLFTHLQHVRSAADVVFQLPVPRAIHVKKQIVISVIYPSLRPHLAIYDEAYFTAIASIANYCIEQGYDILFMSFCEEEKDHIAIEKISEHIPSFYEKNVKTYYYHTNINEAVDKIISAKAVIATRFHAMILGWISHKAVYPIIYSPKMKTVIEDSSFTGTYSHLEHLHKVEPERILTALLAKPMNIRKARQHAAHQFSKLDDYLM